MRYEKSQAFHNFLLEIIVAIVLVAGLFALDGRNHESSKTADGSKKHTNVLVANQ